MNKSKVHIKEYLSVEIPNNNQNNAHFTHKYQVIEVKDLLSNSLMLNKNLQVINKVRSFNRELAV